MLVVKYALTRLLLAVPTLFVVVSLIFVIVRVAPGDPATAMLGDRASKEAVDALKSALGLNKPLYLQYVDFMGGLVKGDLGKSMITRKPVGEQLRFALPYSVELTIAAIIVGLGLGVPTGILTAVRRNTITDYVGRIFSLTGLSFPAFYLGILLLFFFGLKLGLFPTIGAAPFDKPLKNLHHLILPALSLGLIETAFISRMTRSVMINVLGDDYVRTARAKGLAARVVMVRHALRPALIPIVALVGISTISLVGSSVLTEIVFSRPGLGKLMVGAVKQRDYTLLQSIMVVYAFIIVIINLITDLVYGLVDPRIRYD